MRFPSRAYSPRSVALRLTACGYALIAVAVIATCDHPVTNPSDATSPPHSPQAAAAADSGQAGVCDRTWQVREEILDETGKDDCAEVTAADLAAIRFMNLAWYGFDMVGESAETCEDADLEELGPGLDGARRWSELIPGKPACGSLPLSRPQVSAAAASDTTRITALKEGDFDGLTGLWFLTLERQGLSALPEGIFDELGELTDLSLAGNVFRTLPEGVFGNLGTLTKLNLSYNLLSRLPAVGFDGLDSLEELDLLLNNLHGIPAGAFSGLGQLSELDLRANNIAKLSTDAFAGLDSLEHLLLDYNRIDELEEGVFDGLGNLLVLWMDLNRLTELPEGVFDGLGELRMLTLTQNLLTEIPDGAFANLERLRTLLLDGNWLTEVSSGAFDGLGNLSGLELCCNRIDTLAEDVFADIPLLDTLHLNSNRLTTLPAGVFDGMSELDRLVLSYNQLDTLPVGVFDGLDGLRSLYLRENGLTGLPEGVFDDLGDLIILNLADNQLATLPEGVFAGLRDLRLLYLYDNQLSELPEGVFSRLDRLGILHLAENRLASLPDGVFDDLEDLRGVSVQGNRLADLPPGLFAGLNDLNEALFDENPGAPFPLRLELARTDDTDPLAPPPATVRVRVAEGAPFRVNVRLASRGGSLSNDDLSIRVGATESRSVTASADTSAAHTLVIDSIWDDLSWFDEDDYLGLEFIAGPPLVLANPAEVTVDIPAAYLTQASQTLDGRVPLVAGRKALLRVFATVDVEASFQPRARATFHAEGDTFQVDLEPPALISRTVDESRLDASFTAVVPAEAIRPGAEMVVELDPTGVIPATAESRLRLPETGRMALDVVALDTFDLTLVPIAFGSDQTGRNDAVAALAEDMAGEDSRDALHPTRVMLPIADMKVTAREPYVTWADTLEQGILALLDELRLLRHIEAGDTDTHYHGLFASPATHYPDNWSGILGAAYVSAWTGLSLSHDRTGKYFSGLPITVAHELGHNLSLLHAPCGTFIGVDPRFPHPRAAIGVWGYEPGTGASPGRLLNPERHRDLMSYCLPQGMSDFSFTMALDYRHAISAAAMARRPAAARETLLLWGSIRDGELTLEPVFEWTGPLKVPESPGPYRLTGTDRAGARLFDLRFAPDETGHGDRGFLFAIEAEADWAGTFATVTLTGPEGSVAARAGGSGAGAGGSGAIITDRATGRVVSIVRDWEGVLEREGAFPRALGTRGGVVVRRSVVR